MRTIKFRAWDKDRDVVTDRMSPEQSLSKWMMGYPRGWTELDASIVLAMRLSRRLQKKSLKQ